MTVPTQRGGGRDQVLEFVAESLRSLQESVTTGFRDINQALSQLPDTYIARREFDRYRDEKSVAWAAACLNHDKDIETVQQQIADNEARRVARGRYVMTTLIALAAVLVALTALVIAHF